MERILTIEQMRSADAFTIENLGVSEEILVERAGYAVADVIKSRFLGGRVLVCIGKGKNGEDGRIIADILSKTHGFSVATINVYNGILKMFDKKYDIIVDCILGTGLNRDVEGKYKAAIEKINASDAFVIACDIPSGLNGNTGKVMGAAVKADLTIAIQEYKTGHFLGDGPDYSGEIVCKDIGISIWGDDYIKRISDDDARHFFPQRQRNVHKGNFGKAAVVGGNKNYTGSVILSANALCAMKMGAGYSHLAVPESLFNAYVGKVPECTLSTFSDKDGQVVFNKGDMDFLLKYHSIAIGMGMGTSFGVYECIKYLLENYEGNLIIDADGLNALSLYGVDIIKEKKCNLILTPHIGEFSRLVKVDKQEILSDITNYAVEFAKKYKVVLLLKNAISVITDGEHVYFNTRGTSGMAKAGSGDVLSGFIAGILARTDEVLDAVVVANYLFGKAGEIAVAMQNDYTVTASDIINALPVAINDL